MEAWNPHKLSERFLIQKDEAMRYCIAAKENTYQSNNHQNLYDEQWARFYVFDALHISSHLTSREQLLLCLNQMTQNKPTPFGACDGDYFESQRLKCIDLLIAQYTQELPSPHIPPNAPSPPNALSPLIALLS